MTAEELKKIRKNLPKGSREILAEKFEVNVGHINNVLNGFRKNESVLIAAVEIISDHKKKMQDATNFAQSL